MSAPPSATRPTAPTCYDTSTFIPTIRLPVRQHPAARGHRRPATRRRLVGDAGPPSPFATVTVYAYDYRPGCAGALRPPDTVTFFCSDVADAAGAWSCTGPADDGQPLLALRCNPDGPVGNSPAVRTTSSTSTSCRRRPRRHHQPDARIRRDSRPSSSSAPSTRRPRRCGSPRGEPTCCGAVVPVALAFDCAPALAPSDPHRSTSPRSTCTAPATTTSVIVDSWAPPTIDRPDPRRPDQRSRHIDVTGAAPDRVRPRRSGSTASFPCAILPAGVTTYTCTDRLPRGRPAHGRRRLHRPVGHSLGDGQRETSTIVPTAACPELHDPLPGYSSTRTGRARVGMTNAPEGTVYVREGALQPVHADCRSLSASFSCTTVPLVGRLAHDHDLADRPVRHDVGDPQRVVTILPTPFQPLTMKTFGFSFSVLGPDGTEIDEDGIDTGDLVTIVAIGGAARDAGADRDPLDAGETRPDDGRADRRDAAHDHRSPGATRATMRSSSAHRGPATSRPSFATPVMVHGVKVIPGADEVIKELGEPTTTRSWTPCPADRGPGPAAAGPAPRLRRPDRVRLEPGVARSTPPRTRSR